MPAPDKCREEDPLCVACDFGVVYSLYLRPPSRGGKAPPRVILKVTWEDAAAPQDSEVRSCAFELDLERERLIALGRKGNSLPVTRFPAKWFCDWARAGIKSGAELQGPLGCSHFSKRN